MEDQRRMRGRLTRDSARRASEGVRGLLEAGDEAGEDALLAVNNDLGHVGLAQARDVVVSTALQVKEPDMVSITPCGVASC